MRRERADDTHAMKIVMLSDLYPPFSGGIEMHVQSLSRELSERGHRVTVYTIGRRDLPRYEDEGGVKIHRLAGFSPARRPKRYHEIFLFLR